MTRIIAGSRRGRRLVTPPGNRTRPTTDRVREALFSAVAAWAGTAAIPVEDSLTGLAFLDLYAGSGAVGLEAASRGASPVLLVESDRRTAATITQRNAAELELAVSVRAARVEQLLAEPAAGRFDVVFADPPYELASATVTAQWQALVGQGWLARDALLVVERSRRDAPPTWPGPVQRQWSRNYGETSLHFGAASTDRDDPGDPS